MDRRRKIGLLSLVFRQIPKKLSNPSIDFERKRIMSRKELVFKALQHEAVDRVPWTPYVRVHAGKLKGHSAKDVLTGWP